MPCDTAATDELVIRPIAPDSAEEIELVGRRMRCTLEEVLGEERGRTMYSLDWLFDRVRQHLTPSVITGDVFVADDGLGTIVGHTIVRLDHDVAGAPIGLFSTTYVAPHARERGIAGLLLERGERWMREHQMPQAVTYTDQENEKLQALYIRYGYQTSPMPNGFVKLVKSLA